MTPGVLTKSGEKYALLLHVAQCPAQQPVEHIRRQPKKIEEDHLSEQEIVFSVFWRDIFHVCILLKKGVFQV